MHKRWILPSWEFCIIIINVKLSNIYLHVDFKQFKTLLLYSVHEYSAYKSTTLIKLI